MSARRPPATPPELPGYTHSRPLGSGGFSDVFLYRQTMPRRKVAVKVLRTAPGADQTEFVDEANLMAQVSSHPAIVTVYHADVAADGRPFLVMEYCAGPNLAERYRSERLGVAEALRIGVRLAGAVETAHRAGILHRDIKPANVLTNDYGWPALTDFGISVMGAGASETESGMSIPWAAPEFFADDSPRGVTADVYSLAATLYTVLAGRSPFEVVGGSNAAFDLITRITREKLAPIGRQDVPLSLENVLVRAMDKRPGRRYASALDFGRALQRVELELHLAPTPIDVPDVRRVREEGASSPSVVFGETQVRSVIDIDPTPGAGGVWNPGRPSESGRGGQERQAFSGVAGYSVAGTSSGRTAPLRVPRRPDDPAIWAAPAGAAAAPRPWERPPEQEVDPHGLPPAPRRPWLGVIAGGLVVAIAVVSVVLLNLGEPDQPDPTFVATVTEPDDSGTGGAAVVVPMPENVRGVRDGDDPGRLTFTWEAPAAIPDATFTYRVSNTDNPSEPFQVAAMPLVLTNQPDSLVCIEVKTRSPESRLSEAFVSCVP